MRKEIALLSVSSFSKSIYSHEPSDDLVESIRQNGIVQPIWITKDNTVISGHRRLNACKKLGLKHIDVEIREYSDTLVIEANRYREKTWQEKLKESEALEKILKPEAKERKKAHVQNSAQAKTRNTVAKTTGTSHDTLKKVKVISKEAPDLLKEIDSGKRSVHSVYNKIQQDKQREERKNNKPQPLPEGKYRTIVIDPPWPVDKIIRETTPNQGKFDYPTMTIEQIKTFPICDIVDNKGTHIYLWTTQKYLPTAFDIFQAWGVKYKFTMVWHKNGGFQPFNLPQYNCEFVLFGSIGKLDFLTTKAFNCCFDAKRGKHSEKPSEFYDLVRRVSPEPRIDIFNRRSIDGFESYGDEKK